MICSSYPLGNIVLECSVWFYVGSQLYYVSVVFDKAPLHAQGGCSSILFESFRLCNRICSSPDLAISFGDLDNLIRSVELASWGPVLDDKSIMVYKTKPRG